MDDEAYSSAEYISVSSIENPGSSPYAGAFFPQSHRLRITGGTFTSNVNIQQPVQAFHADYRTLTRGDIDLRRETRLDDSDGHGIAYRTHVRNAVRRMYSARVHGVESERSVFLYEGDAAQEECHQYISRYANLWHPNIMQIFAVSTSSACGLYAVVASDELLPYEFYLTVRRPSPLLNIFFFVCWRLDMEDAHDYLPTLVHSTDQTPWIRRSTGRLCIDLADSNVSGPHLYPQTDKLSTGFACVNLNNDDAEVKAVELLTIPQFHDLCRWKLQSEARKTSHVHAEAEVKLGAIVFQSADRALPRLTEVANLRSVKPYIGRWLSRLPLQKIMQNGWTRFRLSGADSSGADNEITSCSIIIGLMPDDISCTVDFWFSQANHIFKSRQITSDLEGYALVENIHFDLHIQATTTQRLEGYLFLCPPQHFQTDTISFRWPRSPWFWSMDPNGVERLSAEEAARRGCPTIKLSTQLGRYPWSPDLSESLRAFHMAKGFDPESRELAIHPGYPLYQLSGGSITRQHSEEDHGEAPWPVKSWCWDTIAFTKLALIVGSLIYSYAF